ncbi:MAG: hypothetical protein Q7U78_04185 [Gallionella sp.]|nr:hypothetical protein [Gallionella sp.]
MADRLYRDHQPEQAVGVSVLSILNMNTRHKHYFRILIVSFCATLLPVLVLNMLLSLSILSDADKVQQASIWQQKTQGITYAPSLNISGPFKMLRLHDRIPEINTVIFGSSTALGITGAMFPIQMQAYNFAQTGHGLTANINEAQWLISNTDGIKYMVIPLDWSLGFLYEDGEPFTADLSPAGIQTQISALNHSISLIVRLQDALSYPRVISLFNIFRQIMHSDNSMRTFREYFLQGSSDNYRCADGGVGKDFDTIYRGICNGFRFDGSATFANLAPNSNPKKLLLASTSAQSKYVVNLMRTKGEPSKILLQHLASLARMAEQKGGKVLLFMPPLLPGMEASFLTHPQLAKALAHSKDVLRSWAKQENIVILDAGQSERFGCMEYEFPDEHHAFSSCYAKIFGSFWQAHMHSDNRTISWPTGDIYQD